MSLAKCECCGCLTTGEHNVGIDLGMMHTVCRKCQDVVKWWWKVDAEDSRRHEIAVAEALEAEARRFDA